MPASKPSPPRWGTLVFLMPVKRLDAISAALTRGGMSPKMPCALVQGATREDEKVVYSQVSTLAQDAAAAKVEAPAILIVGEVVRVGAEIEHLLQSTRTRARADFLSDFAPSPLA